MLLKKNDLYLAQILMRENAISPLTALTIRQIATLLSKEDIMPISDSSIRRSIKVLIDNDFLDVGYYMHTSKTYYVSKKGIDEMKKNFDLQKEIISYGK